MAIAFFISSTRKGPKFRMLKLNKETMVATLQGETGVPFERKIDQASLDLYGYRVVKEELPETAAA